ncbi:MAG: selenocysteine-specific translation elongation factor [Candidatus Promineifilaceae bacterium]|jgi:selenocysteine-specific elongation factor
MERALHVIGTAGHVDHGKSTLVKALTGIDPDRLAEEKAREMTIDLGFAWLTIGDQEIGIVDVPGHRDFIENMLAGVGSIDLALLVIAADEGVMPQTTEHLAILDLLQVEDGIIVLTKTDLIDDPDWLELVTLDVSDAVSGTALQEAPILPVSAYTGEGLAELKAALEQKLEDKGRHPDNGRPRLAVDRVFTLSGFGTVVTGTLDGGSLSLGDQVEIIPGNKRARVRGLQTHKRKLDTAYPGSRVAINLTGVDRDDLQRGQVIARPGSISDTILIDVAYRHLADAGEPLKHNAQVKLFLGSAEVLARTRVIGQKDIPPGQEGWLQLALSEPAAAARGDRFILRRPSPPATLGGGKILDPHPGRRHRRFRPDVAERLQTLAGGTPDEILLMALRRRQPMPAGELISISGIDQDSAGAALADLIEEGQVREIGGQLITESGWRDLRQKAQQILQTYHEKNPLRLGMPREELRSRLGLSPQMFNTLMAWCTDQNIIVIEGGLLRTADHELLFSPDQQQQIARFLDQMKRSDANTPSVKEAQHALGDALYYALIDLGRLRQLNADVVYESGQYEEFAGKITSFLQANGEINAAQARDLLQTSRKYAIALLEHLDDIKVTRRVGDVRVLA